MPNYPFDPSRWRTRLAALALVPLGACGGNDLTPYAPKAMPFHALASASLQAGGAAVSLPLTTAIASGAVSITGDTSCTLALKIEAAAADGTCKLTLTFAHRSDAPGLKLTEAALMARGASGTCKALASRLPAGTDDVVYKLDSAATDKRAKAAASKRPASIYGLGGVWLPWVEPDGAAALNGKLAVKKVLMELQGDIVLTAGKDAAKDSVTLQDGGLQLGGDMELAVETTAKGTCAPCTTAACEGPYPQIRLRDAQPKSLAFNLEYSLDRWLGQYLVVILTQGW